MTSAWTELQVSRWLDDGVGTHLFHASWTADKGWVSDRVMRCRHGYPDGSWSWYAVGERTGIVVTVGVRHRPQTQNYSSFNPPMP